MLTTKPSKGKRGGHTTGHGWFVTFADLMSLIMCYFAMMLAFSRPDTGKMAIVAGSMREAFGVRHDARYAGVIELDGLPTRGKVAHVEHVTPDQASATPGTDGRPVTEAALAAERNLLRASASLRQALQDAPDLTEISRSLMWEDTPQGVNMQISDQEGRPMFAEGSSVPTPQMLGLIARMAVPLRNLAAYIHHRSRGGRARPSRCL